MQTFWAPQYDIEHSIDFAESLLSLKVIFVSISCPINQLCSRENGFMVGNVWWEIVDHMMPIVTFVHLMSNLMGSSSVFNIDGTVEINVQQGINVQYRQGN